jgi:hypothetical protein
VGFFVSASLAALERVAARRVFGIGVLGFLDDVNLVEGAALIRLAIVTALGDVTANVGVLVLRLRHSDNILSILKIDDLVRSKIGCPTQAGYILLYLGITSKSIKAAKAWTDIVSS